jgi:single-strand DNA-binding protein
MKSINQVILLGHLGQDPEHSQTNSGKELTRFSLATSYSVRVNDDWEERTDWHRVVVFDRLARIASDRLRKGDPIAVTGRISCRKWTDERGQSRTSWSIVARDLSFLRARRDGDSAPPPSPQRSPDTASVALANGQAGDPVPADDGVPF